MCTFLQMTTDVLLYIKFLYVLAHIPLHFSKNVNTLNYFELLIASNTISLENSEITYDEATGQI